MAHTILHKETDKRGMFYIQKNGKGIASELTYKLKANDIMVIDHTETKVQYEGQGMGTKLVEKAVGYAREKGYKIDPLCPFVEVKFDENEKYNDIRV